MTLTIESVTHHGMGRGSDGALYPRTLPGEEVEPRPDGTLRIVTPSPDRVAPPCRHARTCGGCAMQHASDAFVADWKRGIVVKALAAQGVAAEVGPVLTSPPRSRRRATFHGRRTKGGALVGFHGRASDTLVAVPDCQLVTPALAALLPALEALTVVGASRTTEVSLTVTETDTGADVTVTGGKTLDAALRMSLATIADATGLARLTWDGETVALRATPAIRLGPARVELPPGAFLQATRAGEDALVSAVTETVTGARRIADLFAGAGTFALPLAQTADVLAVEGDPALAAALTRAARTTPGLRPLTVEARDLFRRPLLPDELARFDAVVLDPPRAGAEAQVAEIARARPPLVVHVSCNPATFAREARTLAAAGYVPGPVRVIDQFRWSPHVELVAAFRRG